MKVFVCGSEDEAGEKAWEVIDEIVSKASKSRGVATIGLSGGSVPRLLAQAMVKQNKKQNPKTPSPWANAQFFFADERCVSHSSNDSNFKLNNKEFLSYLPIDVDKNVHQTDAKLSPDEMAESYQAHMEEYFKSISSVNDNGMPIFDLLILGMGPDGHTCSLFPGHELLNETEKYVVSIVDSPKPPPERITLTFPIINAARHVVFLCTGSSKADALANVLEGNVQEDVSKWLPSRLVMPKSGNLVWVVDKPAASHLKNSYPSK